jgi:integrase
MFWKGTMAKKVSLVRLCKTDEGWKRYPVVIGGNGRLKPNYVSVDGVPMEFKQGYYQLRYYQGPKLVYESVGNDAPKALAALEKKRLTFAAKESASAAGVRIVEDKGRVSLSVAAKRFVERTKAKGSLVAADAQKQAISEFIQSVPAAFVDEVTENMVLTHYSALKRMGNEQRTIFNKHTRLKSFLRWAGLDVKTVMQHTPRYVKKRPEIFADEELKSFFAACDDPYHQIVFQVLLKTGFRMQEAMFLQWQDIDSVGSTITLRSKPQLDFMLKDFEERTVPVPTDLAELLKERRAQRPDSLLVLGTPRNDTPNWKWLQMLKRIVAGAKLGCQRCDGCKRRECERWFLHKFRATYCTKLLRSGIDVKTVQTLMGHSDLATTMRYLAPAEDTHVQLRVNAITWGL